MYKLKVDGKEFQFSTHKITGASIAAIVQKDATYMVFKEMPDGQDRQVGMCEAVDTEGSYYVIPPAISA